MNYLAGVDILVVRGFREVTITKGGNLGYQVSSDCNFRKQEQYGNQMSINALEPGKWGITIQDGGMNKIVIQVTRFQHLKVHEGVKAEILVCRPEEAAMEVKIEPHKS